MLEKVTLSCLLLAVATAPALAQEETTPQPGQFVLEAGSIETSDLIDQAATYLGWNILVNEQELQNSGMGGTSFELQNRVATDVEGCEDLLTTILATKGFGVKTLDQDKHLYEVISLNGPRVRDLFSSPPQKTPEQILSRPNLRMPVTTVVQLQHINAVVANNSLRPFFASSGGSNNSVTIGSVGNAAGLLLSGMQDQVASAIRLLREADMPAPVGNTTDLEQQVEGLRKRIAKLEKALADLSKEK